MYLKKCKLISLGILLFAVVSILFTSCRNPAGPEFTEIFVVTFYLKGGQIEGRPKTSPQFAKYRESLTPVPNPIRPGFRFLGWFIYPYGEKWCFCDDVVTGDKTLYARWELQILMGGGGDYGGPGLTEIIVPGKSVLNQLRWLHDQDIDGNDHVQGGPGRVYILRAHSQADLLAWGYAGGLEPVIPGNYLGINFGIDFPGRDYVYVRLIRYGGGPLNPRELRLGSLGTMLRIAPTNTLAIYNVDIIGLTTANNANPVICVTGTLRLTGAEIRDNQGDAGAVGGINRVNGSGVRVNPGGRFYMTNSRIRNNGGQGVVVNGGTFTMNTGAVVGATYLGSGIFDTDYNNGGVYVRNGGFATMMSGSSIQGNEATTGAGTGGGGVRVHGPGSTFHMRGGAVITGNHSTGTGGGVSISGGGEPTGTGAPIAYFRMYPEAIISNNNTASTGGGVNVSSHAGGNIPSYPFYPAINIFNMIGGTITGNTSGGHGGGIATRYPGSRFIMQSGTISYNAANNNSGGGGVYTGTGSAVRMYGGTITNNRATNNGGGIHITNASNLRRSRFHMFGGIITNNRANNNGGGANVTQFSYFYMYNNASIQNNRALVQVVPAGGAGGGGISLANSARFTMRGTASIQGNRSGAAINHHGGGVRLGDHVVFTMYDTTRIQDNAAGGNGGGVALQGANNVYATFIMGGTPFCSPSILNNTAGAVISAYTPATPGPFNPGNVGPGTLNSGSGGGVYVGNHRYGFIMNGGLIAGNSAWIGGGVNIGGTWAVALVNIAGGLIRGGSGFASTAPYNHARSTAPATQNTHAMHRTSTRAATIFGVPHPPAIQTVFPDDLP